MKWCDGPKTMVETTFRRIQQREEANNKRERALAYAFSHQVYPHKKKKNHVFMNFFCFEINETKFML